MKIPVLDGETGDLIEMEIDQECLDAMDAAHAEAEALREEAYQRERESMWWTLFDRD